MDAKKIEENNKRIDELYKLYVEIRSLVQRLQNVHRYPSTIM